MKVELVAYTKDPLGVCEKAAAQCYKSNPTKNHSIVKSCYKSGHTSILEHASFTFHIEGVSRALLAQLTRHRIASFSVQSQRYVSSGGFDYVIPPSIASDRMLSLLYKNLMQKIDEYYDRFIIAGISYEDARYMLPNACHTTLEMTMNLRSMINFMNLRLCTRAQWEIRELANKIRDLVVKVEPDLKDMLVPSCEKNADLKICTEKECCGRHKHISEVNV